MATRAFDVVIFGATGFTGEYIAAEWAKNYGSSSKWAIAGRSKNKLEATKAKILKDVPAVKNVELIVADALDTPSLEAMCKLTKVVLNCTGPYRLYGEPVVRSCVATSTHYVDISGEPQFIETMMLRYNDEAKKNGCIIVNACGFDSIPSDMGTVFTAQQFPKEGCCSSIEAFLSLKGKKGHATTYECAVLGFAAADELKSLRKKDNAPIPYVGPKLKLQNIGYDNREKKYFVKFPGADASIVRNSQRYAAQNLNSVPIRFAVYAAFESIISLFLVILGGYVLSKLGQYQWGRDLLIKYPNIFSFGFFTHEGPSREEMEQGGFSFRFYAKGYKNAKTGTPDWEVVTRVAGPEPGYIATSAMVVLATKMIVDNHVKERGVLTTASAFATTPLIEELTKHGIEFTVEKAGQISKL
ncbi:hypothetical protein AC1031_015078 [Aphanomyces cochlioides]|nr:hypothetical protein AC1031_015078 [Aphanomyces cochlioides]